MFSATAFHWLDPVRSWAKAASLLQARGTLVLITPEIAATLNLIEQIAAETDLLEELFARPSAHQLEALRARVLDERDYGEIAGELRRSQAVVRKRVSLS